MSPEQAELLLYLNKITHVLNNYYKIPTYKSCSILQSSSDNALTSHYMEPGFRRMHQNSFNARLYFRRFDNEFIKQAWHEYFPLRMSPKITVKSVFLRSKLVSLLLGSTKGGFKLNGYNVKKIEGRYNLGIETEFLKDVLFLIMSGLQIFLL